MARSRTRTVLARRLGLDGARRVPEPVLVEEPMEIRLGDLTMTTTMRTPGHDYELAAGWCWSEGLLAGRTVREIRYCATGSAVDTGFNVVTVGVDGPAVPAAPRLTSTSSSCGICGSTSVDDLVDRLAPLPPPDAPLDGAVLAGLSEAVRPQQELFDATGGSHAAAACSVAGEPLVVREDIGRHNAVDKVVGRLLLDGALPATGLVLWVSGRASFEMVQKAWAAGFVALVSVSAPSSLAVDLAQRAGMVLGGFARDGRLTVVAGQDLVAGG
ncbi:MAG: formate dehydrogenase accessory sulfurtransferase FdhD [Actinomycetes bacterium]